MSNQERDTNMALYFANRAYIYSIMHLVFGGKPDQKILKKVYSKETCEVIDSCIALSRSVKDEAPVCSNVNLEDAYKQMVAMKESILSDASLLTDVFIESLQSEYTKLFLVPGPMFVSPWESPHITTSNMMLQESTLDVRDYYHAAGLKLQSEKHFPDDHIGAMMDYMSRMSQRVYTAFADGADDEVIETITTQVSFVNKHIINWDILFEQSITKKAPDSHYAVFALALVAFVLIDLQYMQYVCSELK